jgi:hypothetical protein
MHNDITEFSLDDATRQYIAELNQQIQDLSRTMSGALGLTVRLNNLPGQWKLSQDGQRLERVDHAPAHVETEAVATNGKRL